MRQPDDRDDEMKSRADAVCQCDQSVGFTCKNCAIESRYNWESTGPDGCDTHCIKHPCGPCITGKNKG